MAQTRVAVIGLGMASKPHLEALAELRGHVECAGILSRTPSRTQEIASQTGFPALQSLEQITGDPSIDAAIVLTPPNQRVELVGKLAAAGKHVLCEKPIERTFEAARNIVATCEQAGATLGIVFQHRFRAGTQRLAKLLADGALGDLVLVRADIPWWRPQSYYDVPGRGSYARDGGGVLISQAIHVLDTMLSLSGPAANVRAMTATSKAHKMESEDFAVAGIEFANGAIGSVVATTATWPGDTESIILDGTLGRAELKGGHLKVTWQDGRSKETAETAATGAGADPMAFPCDWHRDLIADFAAAIASGNQPMIPGREALNVHALIDAIVTSSSTGQPAAVQSEKAP